MGDLDLEGFRCIRGDSDTKKDLHVACVAAVLHMKKWLLCLPEIHNTAAATSCGSEMSVCLVYQNNTL